MDQQEFLDYIEKFCNDCYSTIQAKNTDYSGVDDPLANLTSVKQFGIKPDYAFLIRMSDKLSRLGNGIKAGSYHVSDETMQDTLKDLAGYCALYSAYLESQKI